MQESQDPAVLREQAKKCRRLADQVTDQRTIATLRMMADDYETQAEAFEAQQMNSVPPNMPPARPV